MAHEWDSGWVAHTAAWHNLADIKGERPTTWEEARKGYLDWEPETHRVFQYDPQLNNYVPIQGWQRVARSDNDFTLTIQEESYAVISNAEFGSIIEYIMGVDLPGMPGLKFETLCVLRKGRIIAVSLFMEEPFQVPGDPSQSYGFINVWTRHDGQGGLKGGAGTFRVVCANTQRASEAAMDKHGFVFNVRHTVNWADKIEDARRGIVMTIGGIKAQQELATQMAGRRLDRSEVIGFVERWLPLKDDMSVRQRQNVEDRRSAFWKAYNSATCEGITGTLYGVTQAAIEACDHYFPAHNEETRAARIMLGDHGPKARALAVARRWM